MSDVITRTTGRAGHITLNRPKALNALSHPMCLEIARILETWRDDPTVALVLLDGAGARAFCAGGDIAEMYHSGMAADFERGRKFWRDEYRLNAELATYPKPIVSFLQGFTMGGGVGLGSHVRHRIVSESTQISMPECGIGFVPDVGGSLLLARAPGRLGDYLGLTAARMGPGDAIHAGFADHFVPEAQWPDLKEQLAVSGDPGDIPARPAPPSPMANAQAEIDALFAPCPLPQLIARLEAADSPTAAQALKMVRRNAPLSMAITLEMLHRLRDQNADIRAALAQEYRVSHRIMEQGDFIEGIRAAIIDKDRAPRWRHDGFDVPQDEVDQLLAPLGENELWGEESL